MLLNLGQFQSDHILGISGTINHILKLGPNLSLTPEAGFILRNHCWTVTTKNGFLEKGKRYVPPQSQAVWNDKTIGYTIFLPINWRIGNKINMSLGPVYQNDTFGYSIIGGQLALHINL